MPTPFLLLLGCKPGAASYVIDDGTVSATLNDTVQSVVTVSWTAPDVDQVLVEWGPTAEYGSSTPARDADGADHAVTVYGMPIESELHYRVVVTIDGERIEGEDHTVETGGPDDEPRELSLVSLDAEAWGPFTLTATSPAIPPTNVVIYDAEGQVTWYWEIEDGYAFQIHRVPGSTDIRLLVENQTDLDSHRMLRVSMDGELVEEISAPWAHHDFIEVPGTKFAFLQAVLGEYRGEGIIGDAIVEVLEDGTTREVWNAFDALPIVQHSGWGYPFYVEGIDWTHANALVYDEAENAYYVSFYWMKSIMKIDRDTGEILWTLGEDGDFTLVDDPEDGFGPQHAPALVDGGILFFDNAGTSTGGSRLVEYQLDTDAWTATHTWEWSRPGLQAGTLGDITRLADGTVLSSWGDSGTAMALSAEDAIIWEVDHEAPTVVSSIVALDSLYE